jgi:hypothetical protein
VTYNFDPERWFEIEEAALRARLARGELDEAGFARELEALTDRYEELLERVDVRHDY